MTAKINDALSQECERAAQTEPQREIPVIVTLTGDVNRAELEQKGLRITHVFENASIVCGTLNCSEVDALARLDHVKIIEFDAREVRALD